MSRAKDSTADQAVRESKTEFNGRREQRTHIEKHAGPSPSRHFRDCGPSFPPSWGRFILGRDKRDDGAR